MKKKTCISAIITLSLLGTGALIAGCATENTPSYEFDEYERNVSRQVYQADRALLDGKFDEEIWTGAVWHRMTSNAANRTSTPSGFENDVKYEATVVTDEKGLYVGIKSEDPVLYSGLKWDDFDRNSKQVPTRAFGKTGVSVYVADERKKAETNPGIAEIGFSVDGQISGYVTVNGVQTKLGTVGMHSGVDIKGAELNSKNAQGYGVETFIPWSALPFIDGNDVPEEVMATFASHRYADFDLEETSKAATRCWEFLDSQYGHGWAKPSSWLKYGEAGRVLQSQGEVFGMWDDRLDYDEGFNLEGDVAGEDREVTFTAATDPSKRRQARLYVRDIKDTVLFAEAKFTVDKEAFEQTKLNADQYPTVGLAFYGDRTTVEGTAASCALHMGVTLDTTKDNYFNSLYWADPLNGADFMGKRHFYTSNPFDPTREEGFTLTAFRDGKTFWLFCNGELYATVEAPHITAETLAYMGLTVLNLPVKITDYTFSCADRALADFGTRLSEAASIRAGDGVTVTGIEDGKLYDYKQELTFTVETDEEHVLTKILLNGESISLKNLTNGSYTFTYCGGALDLEFVSVGKSKKVTIGEAIGATVTADLEREYESGETVEFTVEPESDYYEIVSVMVNGEEVTATGGTYSREFTSEGFFIITVETKAVKSDVTLTLGYQDGKAIEAGKVSLQGAIITLTNQADKNDKHTVTVGANNTVPEITGLKIGATYSVTTTAMNGKLQAQDFVCEGTAIELNGTLKLLLSNTISLNGGNYKAELGTGFGISGIMGNRPSGNLFMTGLNLEGEVWFGATVRLSGAGASLNYGSMIGLYFGTGWIEFGHPDGISGATAGNGGVKYYDAVKKAYSKNGYIMTASENALFKGEGLRVAVCRTADGKMEVYFVINGSLKKVVTFEEDSIGTGAITSFGVRLNTIYTGSAEAEKGWIRNADYASSAKDLLGDDFGDTVEIKLNGAAYDGGNADNAATITVSGSEYEFGKTYHFTVAAANNYNVTVVKVNGETVTGNNGTYSFTFYGATVIEVTAVREYVDVTLTLGYQDGAAIDAGKVSLQGASFTLTKVDEEAITHTVTVGADNVIPAIMGMKLGTYRVTTTAMNGNLKVKDFVCDGAANKLQLQLSNGVNNVGDYKAEFGTDFAVNSIRSDGGTRIFGNLLMTGLNLEGEVWFGATVMLSGTGNSLNWGSMIGIYFGAVSGDSWIEVGNPQNISGAKDGDGGVQYYKGGYNANGYVMTADEKATFTSEGMRVAICRTADGNLDVYFVIGGTLKKVVSYENVITGAITSFGVRLNTLYTGSTETEKGWIRNVDFAGSAKDLLGSALGDTVEIKLNGAKYDGGNADNAATVTVSGSDYEVGETYTFTVTPKSSSYLIISVTVNGTEAEADNGTYSFVFMGKTEIAVTTAEKGKVTLGTVSDLVTVSVTGNADLSHEYNSTDTVEFTVTLKDSGNEGYYKIIVKINGTAVTGTDGTYSQVYGDTNTFEISVETELIASDATITVQPRNTGANGKTDGITLKFTNGSSSFTATANENGVINLTKKPLGTYTVRGRLFGGELKYPDVTLNARNNTAEITHNGTYLNYNENNSAVVDYGTSSVDFGSKGNTVLLGTQALSGEVWFTMKVTMPNRSDWNNITFIMAPDNWNTRDFVQFLHNGDGFIKFTGNDSTTVNGTDIGNAMTAGTCYVAFARTADNKFKMVWAESAEGLKTATPVVYDSKTNGAAIGQIGFTSGACDGASFQYISSGATLEAAIAEMNAYEAKDNA